MYVTRLKSLLVWTDQIFQLLLLIVFDQVDIE